MQYAIEALDRQTGDLIVIRTEEWLTITEFGTELGEGPRSFRAILREMGFLQPETYGNTRHTRMRICSWVVDRGWGKRIERKGRPPFDTIGPAAQAWIRERFQETRTRIAQNTSDRALKVAYDLHRFIAWRVAERVNREEDFTTGRKFLWIADHHPELSQEEIAVVLEVSPPLVSKMVKERKARIAAAERRKSAVLPIVNPRPTYADILMRAAALGEEDVVLPPCG